MQLFKDLHLYHFYTGIAYAKNIEFIVIDNDSFFLLWNGFMMINNITR